MKTSLQLIFVFLISGNLFSQYYVRGDHNGWGTSNQLTQRTTLAGGSTYSTVIQANFNQNFKIANNSWSIQWGAGYWITAYDQRWTIGANGDNAIWKGSILTYTQINSLNPDNYINQNLTTGIMTLSSNPVSVSSVSQIGADVGGGIYQINSTLAQTVNITLSASKSSQEKVYLRYTTDNWSSSSWVPASGSGTSYTASIPGQTDETTVSYYVLTSTLSYTSGNDLDQYPDLMTLNYNNNNGNNYTYQVKEKYGFFASAVYLEVNNSAAQFYNCHGHSGVYQIGTVQFSGNLGSFPQNSNKLLLQGAEIKTWKKTTGNVCTPNFYYRVYPAGNPSGSFTPFVLPFYCDCESGAFPGTCGGGTCSSNDQKWQSPGVSAVENINLLTRNPGDYTLEVYFDIPGNHDGNSGCLNTVYDNNNGVNYSMNFTVTASMPVELLDFNAFKKDNVIELKWITANEIENDRFEVQRSANGNEFDFIGMIAANGTKNSLNKYVFVDKDPIIGENYYRLLQVDADGIFSVSQTIFVNNSAKKKISLNLVPTIARTSITCEYEKTMSPALIVLTDMFGKTLKTIVVETRSIETHIDISDLPKGHYILHFVSENHTENKKIIKQ